MLMLFIALSAASYLLKQNFFGIDGSACGTTNISTEYSSSKNLLKTSQNGILISEQSFSIIASQITPLHSLLIGTLYDYSISRCGTHSYRLNAFP